MANEEQIRLRILCLNRGWDQPFYDVITHNSMFLASVKVKGATFLGSWAPSADEAKEIVARSAFNHYR
ncbi:hypothetical protein HI914_06741 [Erysiphe necator]|nr:hypothetical protein HI914_06741 [Erysiphe necator]